MKTSMLVASAVAVAISASSVFAADLKYAPGEDKRFNWKSYDDLKKPI